VYDKYGRIHCEYGHTFWIGCINQKNNFFPLQFFAGVSFSSAILNTILNKSEVF